MTGAVRTLPPRPRVLRDWRLARDRLRSLWRRLLRFRTTVIAVTLTAVTILATCLAMALVIQNELFTARKDQVLLEPQRATASTGRARRDPSERPRAAARCHVTAAALEPSDPLRGQAPQR